MLFHLLEEKLFYLERITLLKKTIIKGPFGEHGHVREYAMYEVEFFLEPYFEVVLTAGINNFSTTQMLPLIRILPTSLCDDLLFIARRKKEQDTNVLS
jgi:hypothetical protein